MAHKFDPAKMDVLDDPERNSWQNTSAFLEFLQLRPDALVADVGAGTGFFTIPVAQYLQGTGTVFAVDTEPQMLTRLKERFEERQLSGWVIPVLSQESEIPLPDNSIDLILMANVFHELKAPSEMASELGRILRPQGHMVVIDWGETDPLDEANQVGPAAHHRVSPNDVMDCFEGSGFQYILSWDGFPLHFTFVFQNSSSTELQ